MSRKAFALGVSSAGLSACGRGRGSSSVAPATGAAPGPVPSTGPQSPRRVAGYALQTSLRPGDTLQIALRASTPGNFGVDFVRNGALNHNVFADRGRANLTNGSVIGTGADLSDAIIGYETDAAAYALGPLGLTLPTGVDGTPTDDSFTILGFDDCRSFQSRPGFATMGVLHRANAGTVFAAGTINWAGGLSGRDQQNITRITSNVLAKLSVRGA
jgi:hypothetical protein